MVVEVDFEPMGPGFESRKSHNFIFFFFSFIYFCFLLFFFVIIITVQICKFNITVSTQFSYFITPYDAQASSAISALILSVLNGSRSEHVIAIYIWKSRDP